MICFESYAEFKRKFVSYSWAVLSGKTNFQRQDDVFELAKVLVDNVCPEKSEERYSQKRIVEFIDGFKLTPLFCIFAILQAAKEKKSIRNEEIEIEVIERRKMIEVQEKDIEHREKELQATVRLPAEADAHKVQVLAEASK